MTANRLNELLSRFPSLKIVVIGDYFLDKYLDFDPAIAEYSLETEKTANQVVNIRHSPGAAGTVVNNMRALGAGTVIPVGVTGDDGEGYELRQDLARLGCGADHLLRVPERRTSTYLKPRDISVSGLEGELERYDTKNRRLLPESVEKKLIDSLYGLLPDVDAVMVADQVEEEDCGVVTSGMRSALARMAAEFPEMVFWVDSRRRIGLFSGLIVKPNQLEAVSAAFPGSEVEVNDETVLQAGNLLRERSGKPVFLTRAERGIMIFEENGVEEVRGVRVDGSTDPTGAGDSATAAAVSSLAAGSTHAEAALMANLVASITVQQIGVTGTASPVDLPARLELWRGQG